MDSALAAGLNGVSQLVPGDAKQAQQAAAASQARTFWACVSLGLVPEAGAGLKMSSRGCWRPATAALAAGRRPPLSRCAP